MYEIGQSEIDAVTNVLRSGQLFRYRGGEGGEVDTCEAKLRQMFDSHHALVVTSGTGALIAGLVGLGIGPGDEVLVPAYTWLASAGAILSVGAIPVLVEIDETLTLDTAEFERMIGPQTKAVIPVHMGSRPSDMDAIMAIAQRHNLYVLEDACQAIGATYKGKALGAIGDAGTFSFNQFKAIACGEGGALLTNSRKIYERALYYHDMGCTFRSHAGTLSEEPFLGNTLRMNELLGAMLRVQLDRLDDIMQRLRERQGWILDVVRAHDVPFAISPSHDAAGDAGQYATFIFSDAKLREAVATRAYELQPECSLGTPINSGLHVYTNWNVLLEQQGGFHPAINPYLRPENSACRKELTQASCPRTLDILARTATLGINPKMTREECEAVAATLCRAAREVTTP